MLKMERVKKDYQEVGQNLQKKNFTPNNEDWIELGILADWLLHYEDRSFYSFVGA
ncbi:MAG: hypothetical protein HS129_02220 [Leptospiraceae bacterium]|nr:hypothetical protein [Leptospiraceae bacterium]